MADTNSPIVLAVVSLAVLVLLIWLLYKLVTWWRPTDDVVVAKDSPVALAVATGCTGLPPADCVDPQCVHYSEIDAWLWTCSPSLPLTTCGVKICKDACGNDCVWERNGRVYKESRDENNGLVCTPWCADCDIDCALGEVATCVDGACVCAPEPDEDMCGTKVCADLCGSECVWESDGRAYRPVFDGVAWTCEVVPPIDKCASMPCGASHVGVWDAVQAACKCIPGETE